MTKKNASKREILNEIRGLAAQHHISAKEITAVLNTSRSSKQNTETFMKLFAYLGGILIFSGMSIYLGTFWTSMSSITKIIMTFGTGIILYILAAMLSTYYKNNEDMLTPLFLTSTFFQTSGLFIIFYEFKVEMDFMLGSALIFGALLAQQLLLFTRIQRASLLFTSLFFWCAFFATFLDSQQASENTIGILVGLSVFIIAYLLDRKSYTSLASFWYVIGAILFLNGLFDALKGSWLEFGFILMCGLMLYFSTFIKNRALLFVSTLSALVYIGYFTSKHFMHSAGWPILLVLVGLICFGLGVMVLKISKKYM